MKSHLPKSGNEKTGSDRRADTFRPGIFGLGLVNCALNANYRCKVAEWHGGTARDDLVSFTSTLEKAIHESMSIAFEQRHEFVSLDHLLLALIDEPSAARVLVACGVDTQKLKSDVRKHVEQATNPAFEDMPVKTAVPTTGFQRVLQRAAEHVRASRKSMEITGANVLVAIFGERKSTAVQLLRVHGITRFDAVNFIAHGIAKNPKFQNPKPVVGAEEAEGGTDNQQSDDGQTESALDKYCVNLNEKARAGDVDPLIGRKDELLRCFKILIRRNKNNPLLVGDPGVGKTAIVEGMARRIVEGEAPEAVSRAVIYSLDMGEVLAGTRYRGDFEERLKSVVKELEEQPEAILFIDEIHTVVGAGATSGGSMDASNLLKPGLQGGKLRCIGSTTHKEFRQYFEKDRALSRRFQKIDVPEPTNDETIRIIRGLKPRFERHHRIRFTDEAIRSAVELSGKYISNRRFPDKAIDVIDEAGAAQRLLPDSRKRKTIRQREVEEVVATMARIPSRHVTRSDADMLQDLETNLKSVVFGQDPAIRAISAAIKMSRAGLRETEKPVGAYLFAGPTGVGKTESARQLAESMGVKLLRFDMSEFMEKHSVSRLIGAPPGYVGFDHGGMLTDGVEENPHCVLLLDEIEKAHADVSNILLQVMDHGKLTDHSGRTVDFRNALLIMTTNAGAVEQARAAVGFGRDRRDGEDVEAINRQFSPEFRNRLDAIISFRPLDEDTILKVVEKFVHRLEAQLFDRNVHIELTPKAARWLAEKGYDSTMGARPLERLIQDSIKRELADEILFGKLKNGGLVRVQVARGKIKLEFEGPEALRISDQKVPMITAG